MISCLSVTSSFAKNANTTLELDSSNTLDQIVLESQSYKDMIKNNHDAKLLTRNEMYYKVEIDDKNQVKKTAYSPEEYKAELLKEQSNEYTTYSQSLSKSYGWIDVAIYGWYYSSEKWFIEFTYNWTKVPSTQLTDAIVLGADSNLPIYTETIQASHTVKTDVRTLSYNYDWSTPDMKSRGANAYGINVPLGIETQFETTQNAHGYISAICTRSTTNTQSGKIYGSYGHRQIGINPSTSFSFSPTSLSFSFALGITSDEAPISKVFNLFES
ncbi:hypothetical protein [Ruminiclostridium josui]|uniref:hypothetical protein n=1 Tax=Ruminiclostridium josui TaxID=1499 RepID=UPI000466DEEA|nr:hypothetical protein [Ruminiclostridium josui]